MRAIRALTAVERQLTNLLNRSQASIDLLDSSGGTHWMKVLTSLAGAALIALLLLTGCNSKEKLKLAAATSSPAPAQPGDNVRRITPEELKTEIARNDVFLIDVRNEAAYKQGHIKGAKLIPATDILAHVDELPRDKMIVTYCS
jgi:hypothetical protein